jgi:hypothetical protein
VENPDESDSVSDVEPDDPVPDPAYPDEGGE